MLKYPKTMYKTKDTWLNINKPPGPSSAKIVAIIKRITRAKKVGHGGTLDPMANGILPIALNKATKTSNNMMATTKKYQFQITWGSFTDTDDATGNIIESSPNRPTTPELIAILPTFLGKILQTPSKFSAIKINGEKAYDLARQGVEFEMPSREIEIHSLKLTKNTENYANFEAKCSKGTYVRTLAHDICKTLNTAGHVSILTRTQVGDFKLENAISLEKFRSENTLSTIKNKQNNQKENQTKKP